MGPSPKFNLEYEDCLVIVEGKVVFGVSVFKGDRCVAPLAGDTGL